MLHIFNLYAPAAGSQVGHSPAAAAGVCAEMLGLVLAEAAEVGQLPCFILGGFNQDPLPTAAAAALALGGWRDLGERHGVTTRPGGGRVGRRVDRVCANAAAAQLVTKVGLRWDIGVATHGVIEVVLNVRGADAHLCRMRPMPVA